MRAAIYARVSSAAQRDAHTIESQLHTLRPYITAQGWELVETYVDDGRSAKTGQLERRDGFAKLMKDAERRRFDVVVVFDVNRLTRTGSIEERAEILGPFQRLGIRIATPTGGVLDLQSFLGEFWVTVQALVAAEDNRKRAEAIKSGKLRAIAEGRKPAGPTPFGLHYDRATGTWSIDEEAANIVREIFRRVAAGETCVRVADDLAMRGARGPKKGWTRAAVYRTMHTRYACGQWCVDKARDTHIAVPRIVSDEDWFAAQRALMKAQRRGLDRTIHVYLLQGVARCACGAPIVIRSGVKYFNAAREPREHPAAYICRARKETRACTQPIAYCRELDDRVWSKLTEQIAQPDLIIALADVESQRATDARDWQADADGYRAHRARLDKHEAWCLTERRRGKISDGAWEIEKPALDRERKMVAEQLRTAMNALGSISSAQERLRAAGATIERLRAALPVATVEQRRDLLRELVRDGGAVLSGGRVHLDFRLVRLAEVQSRAPVLRVVQRDGCSEQNVAALRIRLVA